MTLALGFGGQIGLYTYLRNKISQRPPPAGRVLAVSGATSTMAMVSYCAHYVVNLLPVIGLAGAVALLAQYQVELFWVGLAFNLGGLVYLGSKAVKLKTQT